eukprot:NODE_226_length_12301_cov_1.446648.p2 type:complete len:777 gc:universal NODE_226_length_12301_cov_1.446648:4155-6485(+)
MKQSNLHILVLQQNIQEIENEFKLDGLDLWEADSSGFTVFDLAAPRIKLLIDEYIKRQTGIQTQKCLQFVIENNLNGIRQYVQHPLVRYVDFDILDEKSGQSMLHHAVLNENSEMLKIIAPHVNLYLRNRDGYTCSEIGIKGEIQNTIEYFMNSQPFKLPLKSLHRGFLIKGKGISAKRRFFELCNDGVLSCYRKEDCKNCRGILSIEDLRLERLSSKEFNLCTPYFKWKLKAENEKSATEWISIISINSNRKASPDSQDSHSLNRNSSLSIRSTASLISTKSTPFIFDSLDDKIYDCRNAIKKELDALQDGLKEKSLEEMNRNIVNIRRQLTVLDTLLVRKDNNVMNKVEAQNSFSIDSISESADDEFFDAIEKVKIDSFNIPPGYGATFRKSFPVDHSQIKHNINVISFLRDLIGTDLLHVLLPVSFCEPSSILFRLCDVMEYSHLLNIAVQRKDPQERLLMVSAFACSSYSGGIDRTNKPFDPFVGETFEIARPDLGFRGVCEQISRTPSTSAVHFEGQNWNFSMESRVSTKFHGSHISVAPQGHAILCLIIDGEEEFYSWKPVKAVCNGILTGKRWIDHFGNCDITCHKTKLVCNIEFSSANWLRQNQYKVQGNIENIWHFSGLWNDHLLAKKVDGTSNNFHLSDPSEIEDSAERTTVLWHCTSMKDRSPANFNFSEFAISLNEISDELKVHLPPTDTRFRPDIRAMEEGDYTEADSQLKSIEKQNLDKTATPLWFTKEIHPVTNLEYYKFNPEYWTHRQNKSFNSVCPNLF